MIKYIFSFSLFLFYYTASGQEVTKELTTEIKRRIELEINPSISIDVLLPNGAARYYNYGHLDYQNSEPDSLTLYEIGSVTKTFTATLTQLYLKDSLHTPIKCFFPDIENSHLNSITLASLLNHKAGVPRLSYQFAPKNWSDPFNGYSNEILSDELRHLVVDTINTWTYSNFGYGILGRTIEVITQQSYDTLMAQLLHKAGMNNTYLRLPHNDDLSIAQPTNIGTSNSYWNFTGPSRYAGGIMSNTKDLLSYLTYQKRVNSLFTSENIDHLTQTQIPNLGKDKLFYKDGWFIYKPDSLTNILLHNGGTGGFISFIGYNKNTEIGVVVLSNSVNIVDDIGLSILDATFELNHPQRTIAYELADSIDALQTDGLIDIYNRLKKDDYPDNIVDVYWLERFHFGNGNYKISNQLSDIMVNELPDDWEVHDIKGQNLEKLNAYDKAITAYQKALALNPENKQLVKKIERCKIKKPH